jgi:maltooligosyltrehalose trehalohydrolase
MRLGAVLSDDAFVLRSLRGPRGDRLLIVNFGDDLQLVPVKEPLLAPPLDRNWTVTWSSEWPRYGGGGVAPVWDVHNDGAWRIAARSTMLLQESV